MTRGSGPTVNGAVLSQYIGSIGERFKVLVFAAFQLLTLHLSADRALSLSVATQVGSLRMLAYM